MTRNKHSGKERYGYSDDQPSSGMAALIHWQTAAECGSIQLRDRLNAAFAMHARKHGYTFEQSRLLCANSTEQLPKGLQWQRMARNVIGPGALITLNRPTSAGGNRQCLTIS